MAPPLPPARPAVENGHARVFRDVASCSTQSRSLPSSGVCCCVCTLRCPIPQGTASCSFSVDSPPLLFLIFLVFWCFFWNVCLLTFSTFFAVPFPNEKKERGSESETSHSGRIIFPKRPYLFSSLLEVILHLHLHLSLSLSLSLSRTRPALGGRAFGLQGHWARAEQADGAETSSGFWRRSHPFHIDGPRNGPTKDTTSEAGPTQSQRYKRHIPQKIRDVT